MVKLWQISLVLSGFSAWRKYRKDAIARSCADAVISLRRTVEGHRTQPVDGTDGQTVCLRPFFFHNRPSCFAHVNRARPSAAGGSLENVQEGCEHGSGDAQRSTASFKPLQRMLTARDWTLDGAEGESNDLPDGFFKKCVRLAAPDAIHAFNQQIPVTMIWHSDHGDFGAMARSLPCSSCDLPIAELHDVDSGCPELLAKLPVVIWLHATNGNTGSMMPRLMKYAKKGFLAVAIDFRCASCVPDNKRRILTLQAILPSEIQL
jgi:hypothetical protein